MLIKLLQVNSQNEIKKILSLHYVSKKILLNEDSNIILSLHHSQKNIWVETFLALFNNFFKKNDSDDMTCVKKKILIINN